MKILENTSLKPYNTFGIDAKAKLFASVNSESELVAVLQEYQNYPKHILGGGSNMLLLGNVDKLVLKIDLKGIEVTHQTTDHAYVKVQAGENWHQFVLWCLQHQYGGVENLSLIPGNVGTTPIQNIGAYGVELKDVFDSCEAINTTTYTKKTFTKEACNFGYRESVFKKEEKGNYIITNVTFKLTKTNHVLHTNYGAIQQQLESNHITNPTITNVSNAVIAIRQSKLPDPKELGNSGSFFKNPVITKEEFAVFTANNPEAPFYKVSDESYKIPAGWLIEQSGFKGKRYGDAGVHKNQALVLVNYGNATGQEIWNLALLIKDTVFKKYQITLEPEVNIV